MIRSVNRSISKLMQGSWDLTSDQRQIQEMAIKFSDKELAPNANEWDQKSIFPRELIKSTAKLGFGGMYCSNENGGSGLSRLETSLIFEALSKGCVSFSVYLSVHNMVAWILDTFASPELQSKYLPRLIDYELFGAYCLTEPGSGSDAVAMKTTAKLEGDSYIINGSKMFITGGSAGDLLVVMCKTAEKEISCILVEKDTKGLSFGKNEMKLG